MVLLDILRYAIFGALVFATAAAVGSWAVKTRRISPFSRTAQFVRRSTDPILKPLEHWIVLRGGNPQNAEWWLLGGVIVGGILLLSAAGFIAERAAEVSSLGRRGSPLEVVRLLIFWAGQLVSMAIFVRVIGSWFGVGRYNKWMRPAYVLTDWIIEPLRKVIPPIGMIDVTPIAAFLLLRIAMFLLFGR